MVAEKGPEGMDGVRIQFWDTTQAEWYGGAVLGMWEGHDATHWLCNMDDDTEYALDIQKDVWRLVRLTSSHH